jgi:hypothetical protein
MLQGEEVWNPKIINIKQYLNPNNFSESVNNRKTVKTAMTLPWHRHL